MVTNAWTKQIRSFEIEIRGILLCLRSVRVERLIAGGDATLAVDTGFVFIEHRICYNVATDPRRFLGYIRIG